MWDLLYAIDASASMADTHRAPRGSSFVKMDLVTETIGGFLTSGLLPFGSRIGVMTFQAPTKAAGMFLKGGTEMTKMVVPIARIDAMTRDEIGSKLAAVQTGGATPSGLAIEEGLRQLYAVGDGPIRRIKKLVLITDEKSNVGPKPERVVGSGEAARAIIDVIAIGSKVNRDALEVVAARTGGKFMRADSAEELSEAMMPRIEVRGVGAYAEVLARVNRSELELENGRRLGTGSKEYREALERARQVRLMASKRLTEVTMVKGQSDAELRMLVSHLDREMPMQEYARRVWPTAADLDQAEKVEKDLSRAMDLLTA